MERRAVLLTLAGLGTACASVDRVSFDRGDFAIWFTKLMTWGQQLLATAIGKNTKAGVPNAHAQALQSLLDQLVLVQKEVEKQIREAPEKANTANAGGLGQAIAILEKALPIVLPLVASV